MALVAKQHQPRWRFYADLAQPCEPSRSAHQRQNRPDWCVGRKPADRLPTTGLIFLSDSTQSQRRLIRLNSCLTMALQDLIHQDQISKGSVLLNKKLFNLRLHTPHYIVPQYISHIALFSGLLNADKLHIFRSFICVAFDGSGCE